MGMRILVTGASGFLGSHVAEQAALNGFQVRALVRATSNRQFLETLPSIEFALGAVEDVPSLERAVEGVDAVVHAAGIVKARRLVDFDQVNVQGTRNIVAAAVRRASKLRRFVQVSSLAAVGPSPDGRPIVDGTEPKPVSRYGRSKLEGEYAVLSASDRMPVTVIRPPLIYGPRDKECLAFFTSIQRGVLPILGDGRNTLSLITAPDCARACIQALTADTPSGRNYLIDDGEIYVWREALAEIEKALGKRAWLRSGLPLPIVFLAAAGSQLWGSLTNTAQMLTLDKIKEFRQRHWVCSGANARRELGWSPTTRWPAGVAQTLTWYRAVGWLRGPRA